MRDPEPCRIKHTEDTEQQTGWYLFLIYSLIMLTIKLFQGCIIYKTASNW